MEDSLCVTDNVAEIALSSYETVERSVSGDTVTSSVDGKLFIKMRIITCTLFHYFDITYS